MKQHGTPLLLFGFMILSGCSRLDIVMRWADTFVMSSVTDYFELTSEQDDLAREEFKSALKDVQKKDFPAFVERLREFAEQVEKKDLTDTKMDQFLASVDKSLKVSLARFEPMAQKLVADQVKTDFKMFDKEFSRKLEKDMKKAKDPAEQLEKARKNVERFVKETVGQLRPEQEIEIQAFIKAEPFPAILQVESRQFTFDKFREIRKEAKKREEYVHKYFTDWDSLQTPEYRKARDISLGKYRGWIKKVLGSLDDKQRAHLVESLRSRADELRRIAER